MFGLGWPEVIVIAVVGVAIFGAKRIPEIGRSVGQALRGFKDEVKGDDTEDSVSQPSGTGAKDLRE